MLKPARTYEEACRVFRWRIPERYNLAFDTCDRQTMGGADGHRTALIIEAEDGSVERYTFHVLRLLSNRLANVLAGKGIGTGDRVAVSFGPSVEAAVAILAIAKMGAVAVPIPLSLGQEPIAWRLAESEVAAAIVADIVAPRFLAVREAVPSLGVMLVAGDAPAGTDEMWLAMEGAADTFAPALTAADDPVFLFYPPHAVGRPSGALHAHRVLPGNLPPVEFALGFFPQFGDILWAPGEWMSFEGLVWSVLPAWHHGVPVVGRQGEFDPEQALGVMARHGVRVAWIPPHLLEALAEAAARMPHPLPRALATGPDPLDAALHDGVRQAFGIGANEVWGVPEAGALAANNGELMEVRAGSPGRAAPGVTVEALDESGRVVRAGERGVLAVQPGAPGSFLGYWGEAPPGRLRLPSGWLMTGRLGSRDLDGYLWPEKLARHHEVVDIDGVPVALDDVEATLALHPGVVAAVAVRAGTQLKAFVVAVDSAAAGVDLALKLQGWVAQRLGRQSVPRRIEFLESIPADDQGKVRREELLARLPRLGTPSTDDRW